MNIVFSNEMNNVGCEFVLLPTAISFDIDLGFVEFNHLERGRAK